MLINSEICFLAQHFLNQHIKHIHGDKLSFFVHYWGAEPQHFDNPIHKHSFFEICYVYDGEGTYKDNEQELPLSKGVTFCSRPGVWHQIKSDTGLFLLFVAFELSPDQPSDDLLSSYHLLEQTRNFFIHSSTKNPIPHIWAALLHQAINPSPFQQTVASHLAYSLLSSFPSLFADRQTKRVKKSFPNRAISTQLYKARLFISDNLTQPLKLKDVASYLHISPRHLSRLYSLELGQSFTNYIRNERIKHATSLLQTSSLPIKEIASQCGFRSVHYMTRVFTQMTGVTPAAYRKMFKHDHLN